MAVVIKRVYEEAARSDGTRVLVDRLWPRGVSRERAALDAWLKELAPSDELRRWYHAHPEEWNGFRRKYLKEFSRPEAITDLDELYRLASGRKRLTLLFASRDLDHNNAAVLRDLLDGMRKPPTGTGAGAATASRGRKVRAMPRP